MPSVRTSRSVRSKMKQDCVAAYVYKERERKKVGIM